MTPSQLSTWRRHAYHYRYSAFCTDAEAVAYADADMAGEDHPLPPRDPDWRCQPEKA